MILNRNRTKIDSNLVVQRVAQSEYLNEYRNQASFFVTGFVGDYQSTRCGDLQAGCARADGEPDKPRNTLITQRLFRNFQS
jgi:hypothetical protein